MVNSRNVIRVVINSKFRRNPLTETSSDFTYQLNRTVNRITDVKIENIQIPYSFYAINTNNNILKFNNNINSITITPGNYTITTLITELKTRMDLAFPGQNTVVTFSNQTMKLTISKDVAFIVDAAVDVVTSTAAAMLGFNVSSPNALSNTGDGVVNISGPNYILLHSTFLTRFTQNSILFVNELYQNAFLVIHVTSSPGEIIINEPREGTRLPYKFLIRSSDVIDFQLKCNNGNIIDLNGLDWSMEIVFYIE